jgi:transcription elongation factor/antiterminator RfaH
MRSMPPCDASIALAKTHLRNTDNGLPWYAVHAQPHREARAQVQLANQGFVTYLPKRLKTVRHARKLATINAPFFPRYLFVSLDLSIHPWRRVNNTFGVSTLVMAGDRPHPVPHGVVEAMIASTKENGILSFEQTLQVGGTVRLLAGPFAEQLGTLERLDDNGRVRVLLNILGGQVPVRIARELVVTA